MEPQLHLRMRGGNIFASKTAFGVTVTGIALEVTVWNSGGPSAAIDWELAVILKDEKPLKVLPTKIPPVLNLTGEHSSPVIHGRDSLIEKVGASDITRKPVTGILLFYAPVVQERILAAGTVFNLTVTDINNQPSHVMQNLDEWPRG